jgi:hypothetical protein
MKNWYSSSVHNVRLKLGFKDVKIIQNHLLIKRNGSCLVQNNILLRYAHPVATRAVTLKFEMVNAAEARVCLSMSNHRYLYKANTSCIIVDANIHQHFLSVCFCCLVLAWRSPPLQIAFLWAMNLSSLGVFIQTTYDHKLTKYLGRIVIEYKRASYLYLASWPLNHALILNGSWFMIQLISISIPYQCAFLITESRSNLNHESRWRSESRAWMNHAPKKKDASFQTADSSNHSTEFCLPASQIFPLGRLFLNCREGRALFTCFTNIPT